MPEDLTWSTIAAFGAAVSAIFAVVSAIVAISQICEDRRWRKRDRTFSHSPNRNELFLNSIKGLEKDYKEFKISVSEIKAGLDKGEKLNKPKISKSKTENLSNVANFWGQMAMEYNLGHLDKKLAKELLNARFTKFCYVFEDWLNDEKRIDIYRNILELFEEWTREIDERTAERLRKRNN